MGEGSGADRGGGLPGQSTGDPAWTAREDLAIARERLRPLVEETVTPFVGAPPEPPVDFWEMWRTATEIAEQSRGQVVWLRPDTASALREYQRDKEDWQSTLGTWVKVPVFGYTTMIESAMVRPYEVLPEGERPECYHPADRRFTDRGNVVLRDGDTTYLYSPPEGMRSAFVPPHLHHFPRERYAPDVKAWVWECSWPGCLERRIGVTQEQDVEIRRHQPR